MRMPAGAAVALAVPMLSGAPSESATIKLATWNLNNLHYLVGEPLRDRAPSRSEEDYATLCEYRDRVGADIYALHEVHGPKAAEMVFPPDEWDTYFSARYIEDLVSGKAIHPDPDQRSDRISPTSEQREVQAPMLRIVLDDTAVVPRGVASAEVDRGTETGSPVEAIAQLLNLQPGAVASLLASGAGIFLLSLLALGVVVYFVLRTFGPEVVKQNLAAKIAFEQKVGERVSDLAARHYWSLASTSASLAGRLEDYLAAVEAHALLYDHRFGTGNLGTKVDALSRDAARDTLPDLCRLIWQINNFQYVEGNTYLLVSNEAGRQQAAAQSVCLGA